MRVLSRSLRRTRALGTRALALAPLGLGLGLLLCALGTGEARAQEPAPTDPIAAAAAASDAPKVVVAPDDSPVVRAAPNNWAMTFAFGGLGSLTANGIVDQKAGNLLFTEIGFRAVLSSVTIPFSVGLGLANTSSLKGPSTSNTDVGLSFTGGVAWTDTRYGENLGDYDTPGSFLYENLNLYNLPGTNLTSAPVWTVTGGATYEAPVFGGSWRALAHADLRYTSDQRTAQISTRRNLRTATT